MTMPQITRIFINFLITMFKMLISGGFKCNMDVWIFDIRNRIPHVVCLATSDHNIQALWK